MKLEILDSKIKLFLEVNKDKIKLKEDGTSRLILKNNIEYDKKATSVLVLNFNQKHTTFLKESNLSSKIVFIEGYYSILKNQKDVPYASIDVTRVIKYKKENIIKNNKIKNSIVKDFENTDLKVFEEKYRKFCTDEEIKELIQLLRENQLLEKRIKINKQEIHYKKLEINKMKEQRLLLNQDINKAIKWYDNTDNFVDLDTDNIKCSDEIFKKGIE